MNCIELSINDIRTQCSAWAEEIYKEFQPQLLIYVAKAGYLIAEAMNDVFHAEILGIDATRKGNRMKEKLGRVFAHIPRCVHKLLIAIELKSNVHGKDTNRDVHFHDNIENIRKVTGGGGEPPTRKILIVDDSVDTGYSMRAVAAEVTNNFPDSDVKIASLNVWDKSETVLSVDFALYKNTIIKAPMSKDSKEYKAFLNLYFSATNNGKI